MVRFLLFSPNECKCLEGSAHLTLYVRVIMMDGFCPSLEKGRREGQRKGSLSPQRAQWGMKVANYEELG